MDYRVPHNFKISLENSKKPQIEEYLARQIISVCPYSESQAKIELPYRDYLPKKAIVADKKGGDCVIRLPRDRCYVIDFKHRSPDCWKFKNDILIETTSIYTGPETPPWLDEHRNSVGWSLDDKKLNTVVAYVWESPNGNYLVRVYNFLEFRNVAKAKWKTWAFKFGERASHNEGYMTLWIPIPVLSLHRVLKPIMHGRVLERDLQT